MHLSQTDVVYEVQYVKELVLCKLHYVYAQRSLWKNLMHSLNRKGTKKCPIRGIRKSCPA